MANLVLNRLDKSSLANLVLNRLDKSSLDSTKFEIEGKNSASADTFLQFIKIFYVLRCGAGKSGTTTHYYCKKEDPSFDTGCSLLQLG